MQRNKIVSMIFYIIPQLFQDGATADVLWEWLWIVESHKYASQTVLGHSAKYLHGYCCLKRFKPIIGWENMPYQCETKIVMMLHIIVTTERKHNLVAYKHNSLCTFKRLRGSIFGCFGLVDCLVLYKYPRVPPHVNNVRKYLKIDP